MALLAWSGAAWDALERFCLWEHSIWSLWTGFDTFYGRENLQLLYKTVAKCENLVKFCSKMIYNDLYSSKITQIAVHWMVIRSYERFRNDFVFENTLFDHYEHGLILFRNGETARFATKPSQNAKIWSNFGSEAPKYPIIAQFCSFRTEIWSNFRILQRFCSESGSFPGSKKYQTMFIVIK